MTKRQIENLSKYLFDISKWSLGAIVLSKFISPTPIPSWVFIIGIIFSVATFLVAFFLDK
ncbi:MAG: DUF6722 family protein [Candidatus Scalindua sp.]